MKKVSSEDAAANLLEAIPPASGGHWKSLLLVLAIAGAGALIFFTPAKEWATPNRLTHYFSALGWVAPEAFAVVTAVVVAIGMPRLLLCTMGGVIFGFAEGLLWSMIGTLLGSYLTFVVVRWAGRDWAISRWPSLRRLAEKVSREKGLVTVILIRQIPIGGLYNTALLAMTGVNRRDFFLGSFVGFLPGAVPAVMVGAGLGVGDSAMIIKYSGVAVVLCLLLGFALKALLRSPRFLARNDRILGLRRQGRWERFL